MGVLRGRQVPGHELAFYAYKYGGIPVDKLQICLAIAWGESKWYQEAYNDNPGTGDKSYGIWQINMIEDLRESRMREYSLTREEELYDLKKNAECMAIIRQQSIDWGHRSEWQQWGAFTDGSYTRHMDLAWLHVKTFKERLAESGDRLHVDGEDDCDKI